MNYKVGDKVLIFKPSKEVLNKWSNSWVSEMNYFIGKEVEIKKIDKSQFRAEGWSWPMYILENQPNQEPNYEVY